MSRSSIRPIPAGSPSTRPIAERALEAHVRQSFTARARPGGVHLGELSSPKAARIFKGVLFAQTGLRPQSETDFSPMPRAQREPGISRYGGGQVPTDRGFLENNLDARTRRWLAEQAQYANDVLAQTQLDALRRDLEEARSEDVALSIVRLVGDTTFYLQDDSLWAKPIGKPSARVMPDVRAALGEDEAMSIYALSISPAGRYATVLLTTPDERTVLRIVDLEKGEPLPSRIENPRCANIHWLDDRRFLYAQRRTLESHEQPNRQWVNPLVYECEIGENTHRSKMILDAQESAGVLHSYPTVGATDRHLFVVASDAQLFRSTVLVKRRGNAPEAREWQRIPADLCVSNALGHGSDLYIVSHQDAPNGKVVRMNPDVGRLETVVDEGPPIVPLNDRLASDSTGLYVLRSSVHLDELVYAAFQGAQTIVVPLPYPGVIEALSASPERPGVSFRLRSYRGEDGHFRFDPHSGEVVDTGLIPRQHAIEGLEVIADAALAEDGARIDYVAVRRSGTSGAAILTTYGSYGFPMWPRFPTRTDLKALVLKRGVTLAYGYIRGGAGKGVSWYDAGRQGNKRRGAADIAALGRDLVAKGYARRGAVTLRSRSNGGLSAWQAILRNPDVFAAVFVENGVADAVTSPDSLTGPFEEPEIGTRETPAGLRTMLEISPFHLALRLRGSGVKRSAAFVQAREFDVRVPPGPQRRMAAALADLAIDYTQTTGLPHAPVVYRETPGGHRTQDATEGLAFLLWQAGAADPI